MSEPICSSCGKELADDALFCPACGTKVQPNDRECSQCGKMNDLQAKYCATCGTNLEEQEIAATTEVQSINYLSNSAALPSSLGSITTEAVPEPKSKGKLMAHKKILFSVIAILLLAGVSYYNYLSQNTKAYLEKSAELANTISSTNQMLETNLNFDITPEKITKLTQDISSYKAKLQSANDDWTANSCPQKYQSQAKSMAELVRTENSILQQIPLILNNPLISKTDTILQNLKKNMTLAEQKSSQIQMPGVAVSFTGDLLVVPDKLSLYCADQRKANQEKLDKLAAFNVFFGQMDSIIQENDGAKKDLGSMLDNINSGAYTWGDYFNLISDARSTRESLRSEVNGLSAPPETATLISEFSSILSMTIQYCDFMEAGANLEYNTDFEQADIKYSEAKELNQKIQQQYKNFIQTYQNKKSTLTNIDNL